MPRHAYLITAHNNWDILNKQIELIDDESNDIFLLVDKKSKDFDPDRLYKCVSSRIMLVPPIDIYWADYSGVKGWLNLMSAAFETEQSRNIRYSYFHLQSGTCLPIKTQRYIHDFCDNSGKEFIGIVPREFTYCTKRTKVYWLFLNTPWFRKSKLFKASCYALAFLQRIIGVNRLRNAGLSIYNGWANCSITHEFARYLYQNKYLIHSTFKKTLASDELWLQTLAYNSTFKNRLYDVSDLRNGSMRYIDWGRGQPYTWGSEPGDLDMLLNSPYLFARKFDEKHMNFVCLLCEAVSNREYND
jgi:glycosyltransferase